MVFLSKKVINSKITNQYIKLETALKWKVNNDMQRKIKIVKAKISIDCFLSDWIEI